MGRHAERSGAMRRRGNPSSPGRLRGPSFPRRFHRGTCHHTFASSKAMIPCPTRKDIKEIQIFPSDETRRILISKDEYKANQISAKHEQTRENAVTDTILVDRISLNGWQECLDCGTEQGILNPKEQSIISSLIKSLTTGRFVLSGAQIKVVIGALEKLKEAKIFRDGMIQDDA